MKKVSFRTALYLAAFLLLSAFMPGSGKDSGKPVYLNTSYSFEERAADLVSRMTLEEKQSQLGNTMPAIPRLGINSYNVWGEALHGISAMFNPNAGPSTSFPNSVALGAAWDPQLMQRETSAIADEGRGFNSKVITTLTFWSPVVEPVRDPRWGRTGESFGEDPFLISSIAGGYIRGLMGNDPAYYKAVPTAKHYFANNSEFNRHVGSSDMDDRDMREFYLAPYRTLIRRDRLPSIMTCYNAVNSVPITASKYFVDTLARKIYGLQGYVTGDCNAVEDVVTGHFVAKSRAEAAAMGLKAGVDTDCGSVYQTSAIDAIKAGLMTEDEIDLALVNIFTIRMRLGEFDPKSKVPYAHIGTEVINSPGNKALAEEVATRTPVLLKNEISAEANGKILPIDAKKIRKIALIGPQADKVELGPYSGATFPENMITPLAGITDYLSKTGSSAEVVCSSGANTESRSNLFYVNSFELVKADGSSKVYDATKFREAANGITVGFGMSEIASVRSIKEGDWTSYDNVDVTNIEKFNVVLSVPGDGGIIELRVGSPTGNLLASAEATGGEGIMASMQSKTITARINQLGIKGEQTVYMVYLGPVAAEIDKQTLDLASSADVAVVFVGTDDRTANEEADRLSLLLPGNQYDLIKAVAQVNPNTVVVMQTLGMVEVEQFKNLANVRGIIWTGFNGQAQGAAMARILFGDVNPGGKLNATWYRSVNDMPPITDYTLRGGADKNGRTYWYFNKDVSYEFGFGLSYTSFEYSDFRISSSDITPNDIITISFDIKNTGEADGDEIAQIYVKTPDAPASLQRPVKRLKGFKRVTIPAGQTRRVNIPVDCSELWFWDSDAGRISFDKGRYVFEIGSSSKDIKGTVEATLTGEYNPSLKTVVAECGKVVLKMGNSVQTSVTAAMSDDRFYDLKKAEIKYQSNNPSVASVDNNGLVTAKGVGTASITAYVTINGKTVSDSYSIKIMPDLKLVSVAVNDKPVTSFRPDVRAYSYVLAPGAAVPRVSAVQADQNISVETVQASAVPGTAVITLKDYVTVEKNTYAVNFGTNSVSDEFKATTPGKQWSWVRENRDGWSLSKTPGYMVITGQKGDLQGVANNAGNVLLQSANTDWIIDSKMVFSSHLIKSDQKGGIIAYQDDDNFVQLIYHNALKGFMGNDEYFELIVEKAGTNASAANVKVRGLLKDQPVVYFRLSRKGDIYTAWYSTDGRKFTLLGSTDAVLSDIRAGVIVCDGPGLPEGNDMVSQMMQQMMGNTKITPVEMRVDYFRIKNSGL